MQNAVTADGGSMGIPCAELAWYKPQLMSLSTSSSSSESSVAREDQRKPRRRQCRGRLRVLHDSQLSRSASRRCKSSTASAAARRTSARLAGVRRRHGGSSNAESEKPTPAPGPALASIAASKVPSQSRPGTRTSPAHRPPSHAAEHGVARLPAEFGPRRGARLGGDVHTSGGAPIRRGRSGAAWRDADLSDHLLRS